MVMFNLDKYTANTMPPHLSKDDLEQHGLMRL